MLTVFGLGAIKAHLSHEIHQLESLTRSLTCPTEASSTVTLTIIYQPIPPIPAPTKKKRL